jgi:hypothetical protein
LEAPYFHPEYVSTHEFGTICLSPTDDGSDARLLGLLGRLVGGGTFRNE